MPRSDSSLEKENRSQQQTHLTEVLDRFEIPVTPFFRFETEFEEVVNRRKPVQVQSEDLPSITLRLRNQSKGPITLLATDMQ